MDLYKSTQYDLQASVAQDQHSLNSAVGTRIFCKSQPFLKTQTLFPNPVPFNILITFCC